MRGPISPIVEWWMQSTSMHHPKAFRKLRNSTFSSTLRSEWSRAEARKKRVIWQQWKYTPGWPSSPISAPATNPGCGISWIAWQERALTSFQTAPTSPLTARQLTTPLENLKFLLNISAEYFQPTYLLIHSYKTPSYPVSDPALTISSTTPSLQKKSIDATQIKKLSCSYGPHQKHHAEKPCSIEQKPSSAPI